MEDTQIIELFFKRDEDALIETQAKYGSFCFRIAKNILDNKEDSEECVNDTWIHVWKKIPPIVPDSLKAFLGKIVRDISLSKYRANHAQKRYSSMEILLDELEDCVPSSFDVFESMEQRQLSDMINTWLGDLSKEDRVIFIKRYFYGVSVKELSQCLGVTENHMAQRMLKLRKKLRTYLEKEGYTE